MYYLRDIICRWRLLQTKQERHTAPPPRPLAARVRVPSCTRPPPMPLHLLAPVPRSPDASLLPTNTPPSLAPRRRNRVPVKTKDTASTGTIMCVSRLPPVPFTGTIMNMNIPVRNLLFLCRCSTRLVLKPLLLPHTRPLLAGPLLGVAIQLRLGARRRTCLSLQSHRTVAYQHSASQHHLLKQRAPNRVRLQSARRSRVAKPGGDCHQILLLT
jgi:hypothetical protein